MSKKLSVFFTTLIYSYSLMFYMLDFKLLPSPYLKALLCICGGGGTLFSLCVCACQGVGGLHMNG